MRTGGKLIFGRLGHSVLSQKFCDFRPRAADGAASAPKAIAGSTRIPMERLADHVPGPGRAS
jgi:hypothetical protein